MHRIDAKRRSTFDHKRKQFATPSYKAIEYPHRLNFYTIPPTAEITLEQFEQWAIDRIRSEFQTLNPQNPPPREGSSGLQTNLTHNQTQRN